MDETEAYNAVRFAILEGEMSCHACGSVTKVSALMLPRLEPDEEEDDRMWADEPVLLKYVTRLNPEAMAAWFSAAPWVKWTASRTSGTSYYANTCQKCQQLQGDWFTSEPGAPFFPTSSEDAKRLRIQWVETPIEAVANGSQSSWMTSLSGEGSKS